MADHRVSELLEDFTMRQLEVVLGYSRASLDKPQLTTKVGRRVSWLLRQMEGAHPRFNTFLTIRLAVTRVGKSGKEYQRRRAYRVALEACGDVLTPQVVLEALGMEPPESNSGRVCWWEPTRPIDAGVVERLEKVAQRALRELSGRDERLHVEDFMSTGLSRYDEGPDLSGLNSRQMKRHLTRKLRDLGERCIGNVRSPKKSEAA